MTRGGGPLGWWGSVQALGWAGGRAGELDLWQALALQERGVRGSKRRRVLADRIDELARDVAETVGVPTDERGLTPPAVRELIRRFLSAPGGAPASDGVVELLRRLALFAATPEQLAATADRLGERAGDLHELAGVESGQPTLAVVDVETYPGAPVVEVAVVLVRRGRRLGSLVTTVDHPEVVTAWLQGAVVVAHNGDGFDFEVLERAGVSLPQNRIDTLRWSWIADPVASGHSLAECCTRSGVAFDGVSAHTALGDAEMLAGYVGVLRERISSLPTDELGAVRSALQGAIGVEVLEWITGPVASGGPEWAPPRLEPRGHVEPAPQGSGRKLMDTSDLGSVLASSTSGDVVAVTDLRDAFGEVPVTHGWRLAGHRVIDREALGRVIVDGGWPAALGVRLVSVGEGILDLGPPSAREVLDLLPALGSGPVEWGAGPRVTDRRTLALHPPQTHVVLFDAVEHCFTHLYDVAGGDVEPFDPATHPWPVTAAGSAITWAAPAVRRLWERTLGGDPPSVSESRRPIQADIVYVTGVPARSGVRTARVAGLAAALADTEPTVLVVDSTDRELLVDSLARPMREHTGRGLLRPPEWPTYAEAARRLERDPGLAVVTATGLTKVDVGSASVVFDRVGVPSLEQRVVVRLLGGVDEAEDVFGSVVEPIAALRLLRHLGRVRGRAYLTDPVSDSPLVRRAVGDAAQWSSVAISTLDGGDLAQSVVNAVLEKLSTRADEAPAVDRSRLTDLAARLLPVGARVRPFQESVIDDVLDGRHCLAVFRTGQGKSLCYQVAGLALGEVGRGLTVVVSPLVALQRDQVAGLLERGVWQATALNSELAPEVKAARLRGIAAGFYTMVFVAPEGIRSPALRDSVLRSPAGGVALFVVDEAHCISEMGHDFRPTYRRLPASLRYLCGVPDDTLLHLVPGRPCVLALTGTARPAMREDIRRQLDVESTIRVDSRFQRPELRFSVRRTDAEPAGANGSVIERNPLRWRELESVMRAVGRPAIVYVQTRVEAEVLADGLGNALGERVGCYHAGLEARVRREVESSFRSDELDVIVATNAFGMGIDKDDVKAVVHWRMPGSPEALYQEAGRAGRGPRGQPADCVVLFGPEDVDLAARIARRGQPTRIDLETVNSVLRTLRALRGDADTVVVTDRDLAALSGLRSALPPEVVLAYLEDADLVREIQAAFDIEMIRRTGPVDEAADPAERAVMELMDGDAFVPLSVAAVRDHAARNGVTLDPDGALRAVRSLERRGLIERPPTPLTARIVVDDPVAVLEQRRVEMRSVIRMLLERSESGTWIGIRVRDLDVDSMGVFRAIDVLAALGYLEVAATPADGRLPRVRFARPLDPAALRRVGDAARSVVEALIADDRPGSLAELSRRCGIDERLARRGLMVANLLDVIEHDPASWAHRSGETGLVRVLRVDGDDDQVVDRLREALETVDARRNEERARRLALERYAAIEPAEGGDDAYQRYLEAYFTEPDFLADLVDGATGEILRDLTDEQRLAVTTNCVEGERIGIRAGPGTGKTRTLTRRIAYRALMDRAAPEQIVAVAFTRAAAAEMTARLAALGVVGVRVATINALANRVMRDHWPLLGRPPRPEQIDDRQMRAILRRLLDQESPAPDEIDFNGVVSRLQLARARLVAWDGLAGLPRPTRGDRVPDEVVGRLMLRYSEHKLAGNLVDFTDQIELGARVLATDAGNRIRGDIREVYVDEAQDLSPLDWLFVQRLAGRATRVAVGDPRQAINEWRGAEPRAFGAFFDRADTRLELIVNHRSLDPVLEAANRFMSGYRALEGTRGQGPPIRVLQYQDESAQDDAIAVAIGELIRGGVAEDEIAVLSKANEAVDRIARALARASINNRRVGLAPISHTNAFRLAWRQLTTDSIEEYGSAAAAVGAIQRAEEQRLGAVGEPMSEQELDDWHRLVAAVTDEERNGHVEPGPLFAAIERSDRDAVAGSGVTVSTMASSKGLEWDVVFLADASARNLFAAGPDDESCRVFYVAITRARRELRITWHGAAPSAFLAQAGL